MSTQDPLHDRGAQIHELRERARQLLGNAVESLSMPGCSPEVEEAFWRNLLRVKSIPDTTLRVRLLRAGVRLVAPSELGEGQLRRKLWEILHQLAAQKVYLYHTNHLSDRQLYAHFFERLLDLRVKDFAPGQEWVHDIELLNTSTVHDVLLLARYYADEFEYEMLREQWPDLVLPRREMPPYDRDSQLPRP